jgi:predicted RNase H-like nuclease (RuvC/YqgF family)
VNVDLEYTGTDDAEADAVQALAAEAQAVAERLAAQAATARQRAHEQHEMRAQAEEYESRITTLEQELDVRRLQVQRLRDQLRSMLDSIPE